MLGRFFTLLILTIFFSLFSPISSRALDLSEFIAPATSTKSHLLSTGECVHFTTDGVCPGGQSARMWKNGNWEQFCVKADGIYRQEDTSGTFGTCNNGEDANYTLYSEGDSADYCRRDKFSEGQVISGEGALWAPLSGSAGSTWTMPPHRILNVYVDRPTGQKTFCANVSTPTTNWCPVTWGPSQLKKVYPAGTIDWGEVDSVTGKALTNQDTVIEVSATGGGETFLFERLRGLVGFRGSGEFANVHVVKYDIDINNKAICSASTTRRKAATKVIPSQNTIGGQGNSNILQCSPITEADKTSSPYWPVYFKQTQQEEKCYFPTADWGYGTPIADPCSKDGKPTLINPANLVKIINPTETLMWLVNSINEQTHDVNVEGKQLYTYDGPAPDYGFNNNINGSGEGGGTKLDQDTPREVGKSFTDFRTGSLPRATPYSQITDEAIDKWLCQMAATNTAESCINNQQYAVYDLPLGFLGDVTDKDFGTYLPNSGTIDRTITRQGKTDIMVKASDLYCARKPGCGNLATNCSKAVGLDPNSETFKTFWGKLRLAITDNRTNIPDKAIITRCQELPNVTDFMHCSRLASASGGYPDLIDVDLLESPHADEIVNKYYGKFHQLKKNSTCRSCITSILLLPGVTQARNANEKLGCGYGTPLFSHQANMEFEKVIDMGDQKPPAVKSNSLVPVGMNNYQEIIDVVSFNPLLNLITSILHGTIGVLGCQIDWVSEAIKKDDQGNDIFKNIAKNACSATVPVKVFTTLWMNSDTQIAFQCSQNLNSFLQPHSLTRISGNKPNPYYVLESKFQAPDSNSALGPRDMSLNDISDSGGQGISKEGQAMPVYLDKSDEEGTLKRAAGLVPYSQQGKFKL